MNEANEIVFLCPACDARLTVPGHMGGITGPCPSCEILLKAPFSMPQQAPPPPAPAASAPAPVYHAPPVAPPAPTYSAPSVPTYQAPPAQSDSAPSATPTARQYGRKLQPLAGERPVLRQEPRQLPSPGSAPAPTRMRTEPSGVTNSHGGTKVISPHRSSFGSIFLRFVVPLSFVCASVVVVYGVKTFLNRGQPVLPGNTGNEDTGVRKILPDKDERTEPVAENEITPDRLPNHPETPAKLPALPVENPPMPPIGENPKPPSLAPPSNPTPAADGIEALAVLEKFLEMETLEERLPLIETKRPKKELQGSILSGPLPKEPRIEVDVRETIAIEQVIDNYYRVYFPPEKGNSPAQTMLVRSRGTSPPRVVVDPFLDLYGGRFARFAEKPVSSGAERFQVVVSALPSCNDDNDEIPGAKRKQTLRILTGDDTKEIGKAYFGKTSLIDDILKDEKSGFSYGQPKPCTVLLRWNTEEDPERPFIEAMEITALNWNP